MEDDTTRDRPAIGGIVLAAGRSRRMGEPKPGLTVGDTTFLERAVDVLREGGCHPVVVVAGGDGPVDVADAEVVVNADPESEQVDSLRMGLDALGMAVSAAVILPVDHPLVEPATVAALIAAHVETARGIVRAVHDGRPGHPVLIGAALFPALQHGNLPEGARSLIRSNPGARLDLEVDDPGVLADIDTPEDYRRYVDTS